MVKFIPVDPKDIPNHREGRRGRVSYPLTKSFLESGMYMAQLDRTGIQQSLQSLQSCLFSYIRNHELPIKMFTRSGQIYFLRLDIDEEGNTIKDWKVEQATEGKAGLDRNVEAVPIDDGEVAARFLAEKGQVTK